MVDRADPFGALDNLLEEAELCLAEVAMVVSDLKCLGLFP
jgi:hypothetical protein